VINKEKYSAMKKSVILTLIWLSCLSCDQDQAPKAQFETTRVAYRQSTPVTSSGQELSVNILEVHESRCPKDVVCIQAGSVNMLLNISDGAHKTDVGVALKSDLKDSAIQTFSLAGQTYRLKVHDVLPYPVSTKTPDPEDYQVNLSIEKL
jgi:hypothetical protein